MTEVDSEIIYKLIKIKLQIIFPKINKSVNDLAVFENYGTKRR